MSLYSPAGSLFVHIPKTGGSSIRNWICASHPLAKYLTVAHDTSWNIRSYMEFNGMLGHWNLAYKFAVIRSPYSWVEGIRRYAAISPGHTLSRYIGTPVKFARELHQRCCDQFRTPNGPICFQWDYVRDPDGRLIVDQLFHYENLKGAEEVLVKKLGLSGALPHDNYNGIEPVAIDGEYREVIAELFAKDFENLKYEK